LGGKNPEYPVKALQEDFAAVRRKVEEMRQDPTTPDTRLSDDPMKYNTATVDTLGELMLRGFHPGHKGAPLHCRLRYFDPVKRRAGLPEDVAALVEKLTYDEVTITLVNLNQVEARTVVFQAGAYAEHQWVNFTDGNRVTPIDHSFFTV